MELLSKQCLDQNPTLLLGSGAGSEHNGKYFKAQSVYSEQKQCPELSVLLAGDLLVLQAPM